MEKSSPEEKSTENTIAEHAQEHKKLYPVVAIGASAGGLEALSAFLEHIPTDLGLVYVVIQHLSPNYESILPELLERNTKMAVHQVTNHVPIAPDNIYVIPPGAYMSIIDSVLILSPRAGIPGGNFAIDHFMKALAAEYHNLAIGVILSGTANDGTEGVKYIKAEGGITFAQDESAKFQGMPRSASDSGNVDFVLSPQGIAGELKNIVHTTFNKRADIEESELNNEEALEAIQQILLKRKGVDFTLYKQTTIRRRILRRMVLTRLKRPDEYASVLRSNPEEVDMLYRDLLINVTNFFREPAMYAALVQTIFPAMLADRKANDPIRVWCPACATGEEAASIAICLHEFLSDRNLNIPIQIFGTDLSEQAIEKARAGLYAPNVLQNVSPMRLRQFFTKTDGKYQINKAIRDVCIFANQNLLKDPPFSHMDLISCQNVMIYLEAGPQRKILHSFHYGLKPSGFLLLGKSESIGTATDLFSQMDKDLKMYSKKSTGSGYSFNFVHQLPLQPKAKTEATSPEKRLADVEGDIDIEKETEKLLLSRYVPASVVINADYHIFRFHGPIYKYLQPASGKASLHLLKMVRDDLVYELRSLVQEAKKEGRLISKKDIKLTVDDTEVIIKIEVVPVKVGPKEAYYLVLFDEKPFINSVQRAKKISVRNLNEKEQRLLTLEAELKDAQVQMKSMTEEFEATREELQSANEEILSSNEELQSINEELETSQEELQSTNEELTTINEELLIRNNDLKEVINYSAAIVETIREPLILLNGNLRIRTANKAFYNAFHLTPQHVEGQYLYEIDNTRWNIPDMLVKLNEVGVKRKGFITFELSKLYKDRILVFNAMYLAGSYTKKDQPKGDRILITIQDVTLQRQALQTKEWLAAIVHASGEGIISFTTNRTVISWNRGAEEIFGYSAKEMIGKSIARLTLPEEKEKQLRLVERVIKGEIIRQYETVRVHKDGHLIHISISISPIKNEAGEIQGLTASVQDITQRKQTEETLRMAQQHLQIAMEAVSMGVWEINIATGKWIQHSKRHDQLFGYPTQQPEWNAETARHYILDEDKQLYDAAIGSIAGTGSLQAEVRVKWQDDEIHWIFIKGTMVQETEGKPVSATGIVMDITERKKLERQKEAFIGIASHELKTPVTSIKAYAQILQAQFQDTNNPVAVQMMQKLEKQVDKLNNLIKDLLDITYITEGKLSLHLEALNLNDLLTDTVEDMQRTTTKHTIEKELQPLPEISVDKERINQVMINLISNAIKYSPDAGKIIVRTKQESKNLIVSIQDFGIGISKEAQSKIFEQFFRASDLKASTFPGLGLGLFISAQIIKRHKGTIWVESEEGKGTTFFVSFPK